MLMNFLVASLVLASVFITDPDTGQIVEVQSEIENPSDDLFQTETGETEEAEGKIGNTKTSILIIRRKTIYNAVHKL